MSRRGAPPPTPARERAVIVSVSALLLLLSPATASAAPSPAPATAPAPASPDPAEPAPAASTEPATAPAPALAAAATTEPATALAPAASTEPATAPASSPAPAPAPAPASSLEPAPAPAPASPRATERPPRVDGVFLGMAVFGTSVSARAMHLDTQPFGGGGGAMRLGQAVFPWMTIAVEGGGDFAFNAHQFLQQGGAMFEFGFLPVPRYPFSIRAGVGFGAGLILDDRTEQKGGFGGPKFSGALRYEFFPGAARRRPHRAGGFALGPEAGWRGFTPSSKGKPMSHTLYAGLWIAYYWGR